MSRVDLDVDTALDLIASLLPEGPNRAALRHNLETLRPSLEKLSQEELWSFVSKTLEQIDFDLNLLILQKTI